MIIGLFSLRATWRRCVTENGRRGKREVSKAEAQGKRSPSASKTGDWRGLAGRRRERAKPYYGYFYPIP
jgi:hypothetical protein